MPSMLSIKRLLSVVRDSAAAIVIFAAAATTSARADNDGADPTTAPPNGLPNPSIASSIPAIADPGGVRSALAAKGVTFQITDTNEVFGNPSGGARQGAIFEGQLNLVVDADLERLFGWQGGAVHANGFWIYGAGGLSRDYVLNLLPVSSIEALPSIRLYEAWFEQKFWDGKIAVRFGQLGADTEFQISKYAALFMNGTYTWSGLLSSDLPSGGPAYPFATPAVRLKWAPSDQFNLLLGVFDGNPAGPCASNPQICDPNGVNFRTQDPPFVIGEAQFSYSLNKEKGLDGALKIGAWRHFGSFASNDFASNGAPLSSPLSDGVPQPLHGDSGVYGILDQLVYHPAHTDPGTGVGIFARIFASPPDRNLVDLYADGGVNFTGLVPGRPNDVLGAAVAYAHISHNLSVLDQTQNELASGFRPVRDYEADLELTYQYQVIPGFTIQPDLQYVVHPGGDVPNPFSAGTKAIPDAFVAGLRAAITY